MKLLKRNQQVIKYALYTGRSEILDANGYRTGTFTNTYDSAITTYAYVSAARGEASEDMFGVNLNYTKTLITDDTSCPIDENSLLWIDDTDASAHDYIVVQRAKALNHISYAIRKVDVTNA